jgi:hypothetical protein
MVALIVTETRHKRWNVQIIQNAQRIAVSMSGQTGASATRPVQEVTVTRHGCCCRLRMVVSTIALKEDSTDL